MDYKSDYMTYNLVNVIHTHLMTNDTHFSPLLKLSATFICTYFTHSTA